MIISKTNVFTGKHGQMDLPITIEQIKEWEDGALIQNVFPNLTVDQREFIMTGTLPGDFPYDQNAQEANCATVSWDYI